MKFSFTEQSGEIVIVELDSPNFLFIELRIKRDDEDTFCVRVNDTVYALHHTYTAERARVLFATLARMMDMLAVEKDQKAYVMVVSSKEDIREIFTFHELVGAAWSK